MAPHLYILARGNNRPFHSSIDSQVSLLLSLAFDGNCFITLFIEILDLCCVKAIIKLIL